MKKLMIAVLLGAVSLAAHGQSLEEKALSIAKRYATPKQFRKMNYVVLLDSSFSSVDSLAIEEIVNGHVGPGVLRTKQLWCLLLKDSRYYLILNKSGYEGIYTDRGVVNSSSMLKQVCRFVPARYLRRKWQRQGVEYASRLRW